MASAFYLGGQEARRPRVPGINEVGRMSVAKMDRIEIQLPREAAFDTYSLKEASQDEIEEVELGKG